MSVDIADIVDLDLSLNLGGNGGTCSSIVRIPQHDVTGGDNLSKYSHVLSEVACLQKCEDQSRCHSAVYNNVMHECYTKSTDGSQSTLAAEGLRSRLVVLYCQNSATAGAQP